MTPGFPNASRRDLFRAALAGGVGVLAPSLVSAAASPLSGEEIAPFKIAIPEADLDDLRHRLARIRWPNQETVADWSQGVPLAKARSLADYWGKRYDWRKFEARANAFPQFRTLIDGLAIHFIHVKSPHPDALPIILTHGWPGSFVEFLKIIDPLTNPTRHGGRAEDAFHVVIPSLPGFAFSDKPTGTGWDLAHIAKAWGTLMGRLGYGKWVAQGGDWGSGVTHALAHIRPAGLAAAHVNWQFVFPDKPPADPTPEEAAAYAAAAKFASEGFGYFQEQETRPETIGYALADSPIALATWIYEKFQAWTDNHGEAEDALSLDEMLDDISLYWLTDSGASSARIYWEATRAGPAGFSAGRIELPMAATVFPHEIYRAPRKWAEALWPNMIYWNEVDKGGHFAAWEQPALFTEELRKAFHSIR